jgi:Arc/MetJ family transcription regulator
VKSLKIDVNDNDINELMKVFKTDSESEAVKMAINKAIKKQLYGQILALNGNVKWEGNLDEMREQRI